MGEIQNIVYAVVLLSFISFALIGAVTNIGSNYSVTASPSTQSLNQTMANNMNQTSLWVVSAQNSSQQFISDDANNNFLWLTQGGFTILMSIFSLPSMLTSLAQAFIDSTFVALGAGADVSGSGGATEYSGLTGILFSVISVLIMIPFLFAVIKAITKVDL